MLLDEHMMPFEGLPLDLFGFDLISLRDFDSKLVSTATPDWMVYLAAQAGGLDGVITHETNQLGQELEARALEVSGLLVVGFRKGAADEVTRWGLLMAYSRRILRLLQAGERGYVELPVPGPLKPLGATAHLQGMASQDGSSAPEVRARADKQMKDELSKRRSKHLWPGTE